MNKNQKRKLYESIMLSTSKVIKKKLNEMATRSNKDVLMQIKRLVDDYAESNNVSSIEIKRALGTLSRKWDVSSVNVSNSYNSIKDFFKAITIKRLNGLTGEIDKNDMRYLTRYIKSNLNLGYFAGDPDDDYGVDMVASSNTEIIYDFLKDSLSAIIKLCEAQPSTIFGINNEHVQELYDIYNDCDSSDQVYVLFYYLVFGEYDGVDISLVEEFIYDIVN